MKTLSLLILSILSLTIGTFKGYAGDLISETMIIDGNKYDIEDIVIGTAQLNFSLLDKNLKGEWSVYVLDRDDTLIEVDYTTIDDCCIFTPNAIKYSQVWLYAKRIYVEDMNRFYFIVRVKFESEEGEIDSKDVKLALLPTKPLLSNIIFDYDFNWEYNYMNTNSTFSMDVACQNAESLYLVYTVYYLSNFYETNILLDTKFEIDNSSDKTRIIHDDPDWGEFMFVSATNQFGSVFSDTICTTDYIYDEAVLERINSRRPTSGLESAGIGKDPGFHIHDNRVSFGKVVGEATVYTIGSVMVGQWRNTDAMDLSHLCPGIYILYYTDGGKRYIHKILID